VNKLYKVDGEVVVKWRGGCFDADLISLRYKWQSFLSLQKWVFYRFWRIPSRVPKYPGDGARTEYCLVWPCFDEPQIYPKANAIFPCHWQRQL